MPTHPNNFHAVEADGNNNGWQNMNINNPVVNELKTTQNLGSPSKFVIAKLLKLNILWPSNGCFGQYSIIVLLVIKQRKRVILLPDFPVKYRVCSLCQQNDPKQI